MNGSGRTPCENYVVGVKDAGLSALLDEAAETAAKFAEEA